MDNNSQQNKDSSQIPVPEELEGKGLGAPPTVGTHKVEGIISTSDRNQQQGLDQYAKHLHVYVREYISVADKKASFVFTIGAALLVYLYEKNITVSWLVNPLTWHFNEFIAFFAIVGLSISCVLAVVVIFPRLSGSKRGFIFWESITEFSSPIEFSTAAQKLTESELTKEILLHAHELSSVCKAKYRILNLSIRIGSIGAVSTIIYLLLGSNATA